MPEGYEIGLFIHILAVFAIAAASMISFATFSMMRRAKTVQEVRVWGSLGRLLSQYYVFPITALWLILSGAYLVDKFDFDWSTGWIMWSLLAVVLAALAGYFLLTPRMQAIGQAAGPAPDGPVPPAVAEKLSDPVIFAVLHGNLLTVVAIIWNMTTKPGGIGAFLALVVLAGIGVASAYPMYQRQQRGR